MALPMTEQNTDDASKSYDNAVAARDPVAMMDVAKQSFGTPVGQAAMKAADFMYKTSKEFDDLIGPVEKAGGPATPEGRLALTNRWKSVKDDPQWGDAFLMYMMGDKVGAAQMVTGGPVKERITYDRAGNQLKERFNALGQIVEVMDMANQRKLDPREYGQRGGGLPQWENSLGYEIDKIKAKENTEALIKNTKSNDYWKMTVDSLTPKADEALRLSGKIKDLPSDVQSKIFEANSRGQQIANTSSRSKSILNQINQDASFKTDKELSAEFGAKIGLGAAPVKWDAASKTFRNLKTGQTKSLSELESEQNTQNVSNELNKSFQQSQDNLAKYLKTSKLSNDQQFEVIRYYQLLHEMTQEMAVAETKYDKPAFLTRPSTADITDPVKAGVLMSMGVLANKDIMNEYSNFYNNNIKNYGPGDVPKPFEIERAYTDNDMFKNQQKKLAYYYQQVMGTPTETRANPEAEVTPKKAAVPPAPKAAKPSQAKPAAEKVESIAEIRARLRAEREAAK